MILPLFLFTIILETHRERQILPSCFAIALCVTLSGEKYPGGMFFAVEPDPREGGVRSTTGSTKGFQSLFFVK